MSLVPSPRIFHLSFCVAAFLFFFLISIKTEAQVSSPNKPFKFSMAAVVKVIKGEKHQFISLSDNIALEAEDLIKFYFEFEKEAFLYILNEDSCGELTLLFPKNSQPAKVSQYIPVYIPEKTLK